jgi:micrococcal nuclease
MRLLPLIIFILVFPISALGGEIGSVSCFSPRAVDADTLVCGSERVRIWGVDGPELKSPGGGAAASVMARLVRNQHVKCVGKYRDKYRRLVGQCYNSNGDLGWQLIRSAAAKDYPRYSRGYYSK